VPHQRHQRCRVAADVALPGQFVHRRRPGQQRLDVDPLQRRRQQAHGRHHARAPPHPIPDREALEPTLGRGGLVEPAAGSGHRHEVRRVVQARPPVRRLHLEHGVGRLGRAARFGHDRDQRLPQRSGQVVQHAVDTVRVRVVDEVELHPVPGAAQGIGEQLGTEGRAPDADVQHVPKGPFLPREVAPVDTADKLPNRLPHRGDRGGDFIAGRELGRPEPVVPDHTLLVGVRDRAPLQRVHGVHRPRHLAGHGVEVVVIEPDPADIEAEPQRSIGEVVVAIALPELLGVRGHDWILRRRRRRAS
jgi:hypothetical protein